MRIGSPRRIPTIALSAVLLASSSLRAGAQCVEWSSGEFPSPGPNGQVDAMTMFDDGSGPALYAAGSFSCAGTVEANSIVRFDGTNWAPLARGFDNAFLRLGVKALAVFADRSGPALYAAGRFTAVGDPSIEDIARWDGRRWSAVGAGSGPSYVTALAVFDDGSGSALFAAGRREMPGGPGRSVVMKWDGASWTTIGSGRGSGGVDALVAFDDGGGPALWAAGWNYPRPGSVARRVARWDGLAWSNVGSGLEGSVRAFAVHDDGSGPALYCGGRFGRSGLARWDGSAWREITAGVRGDVVALASFDDGSGPALAAGGAFSIAGGATIESVVQYDGVAFSPLGDGPGTPVSLGVFDSGAGSVLFAGANLHIPPPPGAPTIRPLARWDGSAWRPAGPGFDGAPTALAEFDDGRGAALYAGGGFSQAGSVAASRIARFDGRSWSPLSTGIAGPLAQVAALATFDDGSGPALYVGGSFEAAGGVAARNVARWDGSRFTPLDAGLDGMCRTLAVHDDGTGAALYAGGDFENAGGVSARHVARWDGTSWSPLLAGTNGRVTTLAVADDGRGSALFAAGDFTRASFAAARRIARWDGGAWSALSTGADGPVQALIEFDDGFGPRLVAGGSFGSIGGVAAQSVASWDGAAWSALGVVPFATTVHALFRVDGAIRPALIASASRLPGSFPSGTFLARWSGAGWNPLVPNPNGIVTALVQFDDGDGPALYASGFIGGFGAGVSSGFARRSSGESALRRGNVNAGRGRVADVLIVNGLPGDAACRRVLVRAGDPARLDVLRPPAGGGDYAIWIQDGTPDPRRGAPVRYRSRSGAAIDLGIHCRALPTENLVAPGSVPCPLAFSSGFSSLRVGGAAAAAICVRPRAVPPPKAPAFFTFAFPRGVFTVSGVIADRGSANARPVSLTNAVVVEAR